MPELIWDGKYDAQGKRVAIPKTPLPFQTIETVNEDTRARERSLSLFESGQPGDWRNRLIWGDKKWVLPSLLPEFGGQIDLIYIDPPFDTGADFSFSAPIPDDPNAPDNSPLNFTKEPSLLELKAYRDIWGGAKTHLDAYLKWFYETVVVLYDLLAPTGSIYVHLDWRLAPYARYIIDEVFGAENFMANITWRRISSGRKAASNKWLAVDDVIMVATKGNHKFESQYLPYSDEYRKRFTSQDERGFYYWDNIGTYSKERLAQLESEDRIRYPENKNAKPRMKNYLHEGKGVIIDNIWTDIPPVNSQAGQDTNYPTQKPEALLERIIKASSNEGDLVLDCFCGSGTTAAVAEKLGRRWITCDLGRFAIHTARKRLLAIPDLVPFQVSNLGKYERQAWKTDSPY